MQFSLLQAAKLALNGFMSSGCSVLLYIMSAAVMCECAVILTLPWLTADTLRNLAIHA